jgi:hypothetical protein
MPSATKIFSASLRAARSVRNAVNSTMATQRQIERVGQVFRLAVATGRADADPTLSLRGAIASPVVQHRAAIVESKAFGGLLRAISSYEGAPETKAAPELLALMLGQVKFARRNGANSISTAPSGRSRPPR